MKVCPLSRRKKWHTLLVITLTKTYQRFSWRMTCFDVRYRSGISESERSGGPYPGNLARNHSVTQTCICGFAVSKPTSVTHQRFTRWLMTEPLTGPETCSPAASLCCSSVRSQRLQSNQITNVTRKEASKWATSALWFHCPSPINNRKKAHRVIYTRSVGEGPWRFRPGASGRKWCTLMRALLRVTSDARSCTRQAHCCNSKQRLICQEAFILKSEI